MPHEVPLPDALKPVWRVKVLDREVPREEPHVTIFRKTQKWRFAIRVPEFLDETPPPRDVPSLVLEAIRADLANVVAYWNRVHPHNPV